MSSVKFLSTDRISPPSTSTAVTLPLSFFDTYWLALPPVQRLFLFPQTDQPPFSSLVLSLKSSLSQTLALFPTLAADLTYRPSTADVAIDSSASTAGVAFTVAESGSDFNRLVGDPIHDSKSFIDLVPDLDTRSLPMAVMAVQVTGFSAGGGGVAVGVAMHHAVADGNGLWRFMEAWARESRGKRTREVGLPVHDRAVIGFEGGEEVAKGFLKQWAPELPNVSITELLGRQFRPCLV